MNNNDPTEPESSSLLSFFKKLFGKGSDDKESVIHTLRQAEKNAVVDADALSIIEGALQVSEMQVREIMIPRTQITSVKYNMDTRELLGKIVESGHSRFPVTGDNPDEILGILLAKDLLSIQLGNNERFNIKDKMRPATIIPESKRVNILLKEFRDKRNHMAIVVNEYGGISGLVTIEDVLEQIVGEIEDEYDIEESAHIKSMGNKEYIVKAITPLEDFNDYFCTSYDDSEFETVGGIVLKNFERLPKRGENIEIDHITFTVLNADNRSIKLLQVTFDDKKLNEIIKKQKQKESD